MDESGDDQAMQKRQKEMEERGEDQVKQKTEMEEREEDQVKQKTDRDGGERRRSNQTKDKKNELKETQTNNKLPGRVVPFAYYPGC